MYKLQEKPDEKVVLEGGSEHAPLATLKDEYGGISHIIDDDSCYVLVNGAKDRPFRKVYHWYKGAAEVLVKLVEAAKSVDKKTKK